MTFIDSDEIPSLLLSEKTVKIQYRRTSIARTPMARLPWLIRTQKSRKQTCREIFLFYHEIVCCVCTHYNRLVEAILMSTLNIQ